MGRNRCVRHRARSSWFPPLGFLHPICQEAEERDVLYCPLLGPLGECVAARVANAKYRTFEEVHHAFLLIQVGLATKIVEGENRIILREYHPN